MDDLSEHAFFAWIEGLFRELERGEALPFDLLEALLVCEAPAAEGWVERQPVALTRCLHWANLADRQQARGLETEAAAARGRAVRAAVASYHPLPAVELLRRWGAGVVPETCAYLERFAREPGEWYQGAHAALAEARASDDPDASARHLAEALRPRPPFPEDVARYASTLEATVVAAFLARRLAALGRGAEAAEQRAKALESHARGTGMGEEKDFRARFDLEEEEGIGDPASLYRVVSQMVGPAPARDHDPAAPIDAITHVESLAAAGQLDEARARAATAEGMDAARLWVALATATRDRVAADAALDEAGRAMSPEAVQGLYDEGLITEGERDRHLLLLAETNGRLGRAAAGRALLAPLLEAWVEGWKRAFRPAREAIAAACRGQLLAPSALFEPVSERSLQSLRKRSERLRGARLMRAAASRPGAPGVALLEEAIACGGPDNPHREGFCPEDWLGAYAVHGRLADARRVADSLRADLDYRASMPGQSLAAFLLGLAAAGRAEDAARELRRWMQLPPRPELLPGLFAVAARGPSLRALGEQAALAMSRADARVAGYRL